MHQHFFFLFASVCTYFVWPSSSSNDIQNEMILEITIDCTCTQRMCSSIEKVTRLRNWCKCIGASEQWKIIEPFHGDHFVHMNTNWYWIVRKVSRAHLPEARKRKNADDDSLGENAMTQTEFLANYFSQLCCWNNQMKEVYMRHFRFLTRPLSVQQHSMTCVRQASEKPVSFSARQSSMVSTCH